MEALKCKNKYEIMSVSAERCIFANQGNIHSLGKYHDTIEGTR